MKKFLSLILAGIIGGFTFYGIQNLTTEDNPVLVHDLNQSPKALFTSNAGNVGAAFDFVNASKKATDVVVHIQAEESKELAQQRIQKEREGRHPFFDMFGNDFFDNGFFNNNFFQPRKGSGSGVIFSKDGYIITNNHVVGFADKFLVTLTDGRQVNAEKIGTDPSSDLAVIKINVDGDLPTIHFANSDEVQIGEWVLAVGNPFSYLTSTVTAGIVSAKGRELDIITEDKSIEEFIQTDAAVNPGNSGGALVNVDGDLVGINTAIATPTGVYAGYSFAIPSNVVKRIAKDIIENGDIERVNLGVLGYDVDKGIQEEFDLSTNKGFYIESIDRKSAAHFAGLLPGDVIIGINSDEVSNFDEIESAMKYNKAGDVVKVKVLRDGKEKNIKVTLRKGL